MSVPLLPESAPFSAVQRAWLNGFFAGMMGVAGSGSAVLAAPTASEIAAPAAVEEDFPWHDGSIPLDERMTMAEGRSHDRKLMAAMAQLDCGSCGYLCQSYAEAIAKGEDKDLTKCSPGGKETSKKLKELVSLNLKAPAKIPAPSANGHAANGHAVAAMPGYDRRHPVEASLLEVASLTATGSEKDVRFISIDLKDTGIRYEVGDSLGVYPENDPELVHAILAAIAVAPETPVTLHDGRTMTAHAALEREYTITRATDAIAGLLAGKATIEEEAGVLNTLATDDAENWLDAHDLFDMLNTFPSAKPTLPELLDVLTPLQPRLYSIASSLRAHPEQVHLTVGVVRWNHEGRSRRGVASTFMGERSAKGKRMRVFLQHSHGFRLPENPQVPVIMVGPGTGIAPFRAFLQERDATTSKGPNWLFFGDQKMSTDFLYREELEGLKAKGVLNRLDTAFSRDQEKKVYVQHRMLESASELWKWLQQGAHFYVCGDARRMAKDVDAALHTIVAEQGQMSADQAKDFIKGLAKAGRYQRDVY